jgi:hypothetical protein
VLLLVSFSASGGSRRWTLQRVVAGRTRRGRLASNQRPVDYESGKRERPELTAICGRCRAALESSGEVRPDWGQNWGQMGRGRGFWSARAAAALDCTD